MKVYQWIMPHCEFHNIVLWDGENTYWCDLMMPSSGYKRMRSDWCKTTESKFIYIGEL